MCTTFKNRFFIIKYEPFPDKEASLIIQFVFEILVSSEILLIYKNSFIVDWIPEINKPVFGYNWNKVVSPVVFEDGSLGILTPLYFDLRETLQPWIEQFFPDIAYIKKSSLQ